MDNCWGNLFYEECFVDDEFDCGMCLVSCFNDYY